MLNLEMERKSSVTPKANQSKVIIGASHKLTLSDIKKVISEVSTTVELSSESYSAIQQSYAFLKTCVDNRIPVYGLNTNFGDQVHFLDSYLSAEQDSLYYKSINERQVNIIKSLACSLGSIIPSPIIKVTMMLRAHCLTQGYSGISLNVVENILAFLNAGITPIVRCYGSIGASGDLIPLASIAAAIIGENVPVLYQDKIIRAPQAIRLAGLKPLKPQLRDGLAMINGTSFMTAIASIALCNLKRLFKQMLSAIAMSLESMLVISSAYQPLVHQLKYHAGETEVNNFLLNFWQGSELLSDLDELREAKKEKDTILRTVQDYYSLRAVSQGFGPMQENLQQAIVWVENEMNSVNDNPIIDVENKQIYHTANFMGYYITDACDMLKSNIAQASTWIHALLANMVHPRKNHGLPTNIVEEPEKNNGFRSMQLLAAALAVQNRKLAQSQHAYMLPTEGDNQDVNSLGTHAALDLQEAVANLERLTAILFLAATQALELRGIKKASMKAQVIYQQVRKASPQIIACRVMSEEVGKLIHVLKMEEI